MTAEVNKLSQIETVIGEDTGNQAQIQSQMQSVTSKLNQLLNATLMTSDVIKLIPLEDIDISSALFDTEAPYALSIENLSKLRKNHSAQAVLLVEVSGYGSIKKKWLYYLIGTGMIEGVTQGVIAARLVDNPWIGVAVALEEIGQEVLVWGGGSRLFNQYYSPVTLEAKLISTSDAQTIWSDTVFISTDDEAIKLLPEVDRKKRENQLALTAKKAVRELFDELNDAANSHLNKGSNIPDDTDMMFE